VIYLETLICTTTTQRIWPVELKPCDPVPHGFVGVREPVDMCWFRTRLPLGPDVAVNQCALAYGSDMTLMDPSLRPHAVDWDSGRLQAASLDHAMWFHQPTDFHDWHLFVQDSPSASGGRGFNRGQIYARDGRLVAEAAQEALIRWR
jgi:acyl-CoA thioesterase-2